PAVRRGLSRTPLGSEWERSSIPDGRKGARRVACIHLVRAQSWQHFLTQKLDAADAIGVAHVPILGPQAHVPDTQHVAHVAQLLDDLRRGANHDLIVALGFLIRLAVEWLRNR